MSVSFASITRGGLSAKLMLCPETRCFAPFVFAGTVSPWKSPVGSSFLVQRHAISTARSQEYMNDTVDSLTKIVVEDGIEKDTCKTTFRSFPLSRNKDLSNKTKDLVMLIQSIFKNMDDGEISMSPYDTAWVAMVEDICGGGGPQFPSTIDWISNNQLADGSWGDPHTFLAYDRLINTLACVVALASWKIHPDKCHKGISFVRDNINKLDGEKELLMTNGFEVTFPSLVEMAKKLSISIPDDSQGMRKLLALRDEKFKRISWDKLHTVPNTLLFSLEGMASVAGELNWEKLLKLQFANGSFCCSPSSTAFALQQTRDEKCLQYLLKLVHKFDGGVPNVYPVDTFEHNWIVDRLQRLGISRYFEPEIEECMQYVHRYWSNIDGMYSASNSNIHDADDTSMAFRLLRLHGFDVSPDAFKQFKDGEEFFCFPGQMSHAYTGVHNLSRASQVMFPGEKILHDAKKFSTKLLQEKLAENQLFDKWIITKDLPGEVAYSLDVPWYASLPRVEARFYIEQYGGYDDVWIGKVLYRMHNVNNNNYLELAKLDYNDCQALHQHEWKNIQQWYKSCALREFGLSKENLLLAYYIAAASVFEPEKSGERLAWAKTMTLVKIIASQKFTKDQKYDFVKEFEQGRILEKKNGWRYNTSDSLVDILITTVLEMSLETPSTQDRDIHHQLLHAWRKWLVTWEEGGEGDAELFVQTLNLISGLDDSSFSHPKYEQLLEVTNKICYQLRLLQKSKVKEIQGCGTIQVDSDMQELAKLVLTKSAGDLDCQTKQRFFAVARSFYYTTHCSPETICFHIVKVLFEGVV